MSDPLALSLDHTGSMVRDLAAGAARWRRLGFTLAPKSPQMGFVPGGQGMQPWATANHCAMFRRGYLELIGIHEPARFNPWARFMDRFEGAHICAFRCRDADAAYPVLAARAAGLDPPVQRRREAPLPEGGSVEVRFRNIFSRDADYPEGRFIVIEHQTPEAIWQPALLRHPNGAASLEEVVFCASDPAPTRDRLAGLLGLAPRGDGPGVLRFDLAGGGRVTLLDEPAFARRFAGAAPPPRPCIAAMTVGFDDPAAARRLIADAGVAVHFGGRGAWIAAADANGAILAIDACDGDGG